MDDDRVAAVRLGIDQQRVVEDTGRLGQRPMLRDVTLGVCGDDHRVEQGEPGDLRRPAGDDTAGEVAAP